VARAQQGGRLPTIGVIGPNAEALDRPRITAFVQRLGGLGWIDGRSVAIGYRSAEGAF
jgi:putative tryptophan/tyrosine transport system substrate-binding protein